MIRELTPEDYQVCCDMMDEFYHTDGVLAPIPAEQIQKNVQEALAGSPYLALYVFECDGQPAGYGQLSFTYSGEAGGLCVLLEEIYVRPAFQGRGLGTEYLQFVKEEYGKKAARFRLEACPNNQKAIQLYKKIGFSELPYLQMIIDR